MPVKNLIKNIGFDHKNATHTTIKEKKYLYMKINQLNFFLQYLKFIVIDENFNYENLIVETNLKLYKKQIKIK